MSTFCLNRKNYQKIPFQLLIIIKYKENAAQNHMHKRQRQADVTW